MRVFVNGQAYAGDPAAWQLAAHQEIELVYASKNATIIPIPQYTFPEGL